ncbi:hypothetical protein, partial [Paenibacillus luteus]|uniref:hypothetical protein n=1 Tax=Paenibacillus luteus TaxID=2545753 RepID=UPI00240CEE0E
IHYFLHDADLLQFFSGQCNCLLSHSDIISEQLWDDIITEEQHFLKIAVDNGDDNHYHQVGS